MRDNRDRRTKRQQDAIDRNEAFQLLSPKEQLAHLDKKLGKGVGASRQRRRIAREMDNA